MKRLNLVLLLILFPGFVILSSSFGLFNSISNSNNNVFSAAEIFPTKEPTVIVTVVVTVTPTPQVTVTNSPSPTPQITNHLLISEIQINGATTLQDFIELYNPTNSNMDISGWKIRKKNSSGSESSLVVIGAGKFIPAHGFFLWANSASGYHTAVGADVSNTNTLAADNSVIFLKPDDTIVDQLAWGSGTNQFVEVLAFSGNPGNGQSIERKALSISTTTSMNSGGSDELKGNGFDSENNSADFILRTSPQPQNSSSPAETPED